MAHQSVCMRNYRTILTSGSFNGKLRTWSVDSRLPFLGFTTGSSDLFRKYFLMFGLSIWWQNQWQKWRLLPVSGSEFDAQRLQNASRLIRDLKQTMLSTKHVENVCVDNVHWTCPLNMAMFIVCFEEWPTKRQRGFFNFKNEEPMKKTKDERPNNANSEQGLANSAFNLKPAQLKTI